jgi:hypothetical protein
MSESFRAFCHRFVCFHTHSGFERNNFIFLFSSLPSRTFPKAIDKAPHPAQAGVLHALQVCGLLICLWSHQRG